MFIWYYSKNDAFNRKVCYFGVTKEQVKYFRHLYVLTDDDVLNTMLKALKWLASY